MENLTFVEYVAECVNLEGCIILAELVYPYNEDKVVYKYAHDLLEAIFYDYRQEYTKTETLLEGIQELIFIDRLIQKQAEAIGRKENEKRKADTLVFER